jgi:transcriptional regulator with GAF, ATPase, and Fis domain
MTTPHHRPTGSPIDSPPGHHPAEALAEAFVHLADTLVDDYDVIDLLHRLSEDCVEMLPIDAAGLLLSDQRGALQVVAASSDSSRLMELFQLQARQGPCLDCFTTRLPVSVADLTATDTWPLFSEQASRAGYRSVYALPLRLRQEIIGTLNLFGNTPTMLGDADLRIGQAMADVATIGILSERAIRRHEIVAEQLEFALQSRVVLEQAKGILSERANLSLDEAFTTLRKYARDNRLKLSDIARDITEGNFDTSTLGDARRHR